MNKLDFQTTDINLTFDPASYQDLKPARRLIVPIPSPDADLTAVAHRVWEMANATGAGVKLLGRCSDTTQELAMRRTLVTLCAMINDGNIYAESEIVHGKDWVNSVKSQLQPGDTVVYGYERGSNLLQKVMSPLLQANLGVPVYFLSGLTPKETPKSNVLSQIIAWIGCIAIIIGFIFVQARVGDLAKNWSISLQLLSVAVEFRLIWFWNSLFS